jgi:hypothetical protein
MAPLWGHLRFLPRRLRNRSLFDGRSGEAACPVAKRQSHPFRQDNENLLLEQDVGHLSICQSEPLQYGVPA